MVFHIVAYSIAIILRFFLSIFLQISPTFNNLIRLISIYGLIDFRVLKKNWLTVLLMSGIQRVFIMKQFVLDIGGVIVFVGRVLLVGGGLAFAGVLLS